MKKIPIAIAIGGVIYGAEMPERPKLKSRDWCDANCNNWCECAKEEKKWQRECAEAKANKIEFEDRDKILRVILYYLGGSNADKPIDVTLDYFDNGKIKDGTYVLPESTRWEKVSQHRAKGEIDWLDGWHHSFNRHTTTRHSNFERRTVLILNEQDTITTEKKPVNVNLKNRPNPRPLIDKNFVVVSEPDESQDQDRYWATVLATINNMRGMDMGEAELMFSTLKLNFTLKRNH